LHALIEDLAYAVRRLLKDPAFTLVALATLALGIGANSAIFTVVDAVILRPLPFASPDRLVKLFVDNPRAKLTDASASPLDIEDWQRRSRAFAGLAGYSTTGGDLALTGAGEPANLATAYVTADFFATLEPPTALGRTLLPSDSQPGADRVVVLGSGLWRRRFGADPAVLGRTLTLNDAPFTVVGVLRGDAGFPTADVDLWAPASVIREDEIPHLRQLRWMKAIARLEPGVTLDQARQAGVIAVGGIQRLPLSGRRGERDILTAVGEPAPAPGLEPTATFNPISGDYFRAMGIPMIRGRAFSTQDDAAAPPVAIISRIVARRYFGERDPIGQAVRSGNAPPMRIVGVVGDVRSRDLAAASELEVYVPFAQRMRESVVLVARTRTNPLRFAGVLRSTIQDVDRLLPLSSLQTMEDVMAGSAAKPRFLAVLLGIFSGLALVLAAVGIYGVVSFFSSQRAQEIGVRLALGATRADILRLIVGHGLGMTMVGVALGLLVTSGVSRLIGSLLFEVSPTDGLTYGAVAAVLVFVAACASYLPAHRAAATDLVRALSQE
jgi:MacB-like protein/FtsX-like permease family protein